MRQDTTEGDRRADERVELLVTADSELKVAGRDALDLEILGGVAGELENFGSQVLEDGGEVDRGFRADAGFLAGDGAKVALYATAWELFESATVRVNTGTRQNEYFRGALRPFQRLSSIQRI